MEIIVLWSLWVVGFVLLLIILTKLPFWEWLLVYLLTAYFSITLGVIIVEENLLSYPVKSFNQHFDSSVLFEYLLFPVICLYYYRTSYHSTYKGILLQGAVYSSVITIVEYFIERYTDLVEYEKWTLIYTFISELILMLFIILLMKKIKKMK
ncbi:CBO0543 family protein [Halobacillus seohaensis]|uniref:CBO0543 family protein n=1 Tax=Halobacillus seohaensis TaxID=447421 RepID=A0ABW2ET36_9BACI